MPATKKNEKRILSIKFVKKPDTDPDLSHYGEYTDKLEDWVIVRRDNEYYAVLTEKDTEDGYSFSLPVKGHECRFFKPYAGEEKPGTEDYKKYGKQDYQRMEAYERQHWYMVYCYAEAEVVVGGTIQKLRSGGVGGCESDQDESDWAQLMTEELAQLREVLLDTGFSKYAVTKAMKTVATTDL